MIGCSLQSFELGTHCCCKRMCQAVGLRHPLCTILLQHHRSETASAHLGLRADGAPRRASRSGSDTEIAGASRPSAFALGTRFPQNLYAPDITKTPVQGTDSSVVQYEADGCNYSADYGWYSSPVEQIAAEPGYRTWAEQIIGQSAQLASFGPTAESEAYGAATPLR